MQEITITPLFVYIVRYFAYFSNMVFAIFTINGTIFFCSKLYGGKFSVYATKRSRLYTEKHKI